MKKALIILLLLAVNTAFAQRKVPRRIPEKIPPILTNKNLLDAPGYKKAAIAFVPFTDGPEARRKGFKPDSVYSWTNPDGKRIRASGEQIMKQVNDFEKALNERGHSLRNANTFEGLDRDIQRSFSKDLINLNKKYNIGGDVFNYFGSLSANNEFPGNLYNIQLLKRQPNDPSTITFPLILAMTPEGMNNLASCTMEIYRKADKTGVPVFTIPINIKSPDVTRIWNDRLLVDADNIPTYKEKFRLYSYNIQLNNANNILPIPTRNADYYYISLKFTGNNGKPTIMSFQNEIVLNNALEMPVNIHFSKSNNIGAFNFEVLDPIINSYGFYAHSTGFIASNSSSPFGFKGIDKKSSFAANVSIGAKYYNFENLINSSAPKSKNLEILGVSFSASQNYYRPDQDNLPPSIRIKGTRNLMEHKDTKLELRVFDKPLPKNEDSVESLLFNERFFIGPVPCTATVKLIGKVGIKSSGVYTPVACNMSGRIEPYVTLTVNGEGGVDVGIAYAIVGVSVDLFTASMPIQFDIVNGGKADVSSSLSLGGLSGSTYFEAGFCIPIPFFDDICKKFRINIFEWEGFNKQYTIDNTGIK